MLRPTFLGFETAKRGITVAQKGLDISGQNLTNWDTPGYTRQRIDQVTIAPSNYTSRYAVNRIGVAGQGVDIKGISQTRDSFLDKRFRDEYSDTGYYSQVETMLQDVETAISEYPTDSNLRGSVQSIAAALRKMAETPDDPALANIVSKEFENITQVLRQLDARLTNVAEQNKYDLSVDVETVNTTLEKIAAINKTISEDLGVVGNPYNEYYGPNELLDQRNQLLDDLAGFGNIDVQDHPDGTVTVLMGGHTVVDGKKADGLVMTRNDSVGTVALSWVSNGKPAELTSGSLKAMTDVLNGRSVNVQNEGEGIDRGIPYYRDRLNTFASTLVQTMNSIIPELEETGDVDGAGNPIMGPKKDVNGNIIYRQLLGARVNKTDEKGNAIPGEYEISNNVPVTAANIGMSDTWMKDPSYVIYEEGNLSSQYLLTMANLLDGENTRQVFVSYGEKFTGNFIDYADDYVGILAEDITYNSGRYDTSSTIAADLNDRRDEVAGVVPDEEWSNVMMYSKSYQAASRMMTTLDEALDVLINKMGLVGR